MDEREKGETRKVVCRVLTNVIKASPLKDKIDAKAFFMMINTNFPIICRGSRLELGLIWDALSASHPHEQLYGIFLKFQEASADIGFEVGLPREVAELSATEQMAHVEHFNGGGVSYGDPSGLTPLLALDAVSDAPPLPLSTGDLKPLITDDVKRGIVQAVVQGVKAAPIGAQIEPAQLAYWIDANFDTLSDGQSFNFDPLLSAFRELSEIADSDAYALALELHRAFEPIGLWMSEPNLGLDDSMKEALRNAHVERVRAHRQEIREVKESGPKLPAQPKPTGPAEPGAEAPPPKKDRLEKWGLKRQAKGSKRAQNVRIGVMSAVLVVAGAYAWLTRPNRPLDATDYDMVFPMQSAELVAGTFQGKLDEKRWEKLNYAGRAKAVKALEGMVKDRGQLHNLQIRDPHGVLVAVGSGGKLIPSQQLMRNGLEPNDPTIPKDDAPASARARAPTPAQPVNEPKSTESAKAKRPLPPSPGSHSP